MFPPPQFKIGTRRVAGLNIRRPTTEDAPPILLIPIIRLGQRRASITQHGLATRPERLLGLLTTRPTTVKSACRGKNPMSSVPVQREFLPNPTADGLLQPTELFGQQTRLPSSPVLLQRDCGVLYSPATTCTTIRQVTVLSRNRPSDVVPSVLAT